LNFSAPSYILLPKTIPERSVDAVLRKLVRRVAGKVLANGGSGRRQQQGREINLPSPASPEWSSGGRFDA